MLASPPATETSKHPLGDPEIGGTLRFPFSGTQLFNTLTSLTTRVDTMMWCGFGSRTRHVTAATSASSTTRSSSALPFVIDHEMAMTKKAAVFLKVRPAGRCSGRRNVPSLWRVGLRADSTGSYFWTIRDSPRRRPCVDHSVTPFLKAPNTHWERINLT